MEITIGYFPGQNSTDHQCDEAIFELRMNGVSLGEVNLNNSKLDVTIGRAEAQYKKQLEVYQKRLKNAEKIWDREVQDGTIKNPTEEKKTKYVTDMVGQAPVMEESPKWLTALSTKNGFETVKDFESAITKINQSFKQYGRKSDRQQGGARSQSFILDGAKAKSIIDNSPSDKIILSIVPLVSENGKYKIFYERGSHADTPWVTIQSKKSEQPLFNGEPNVGMKRGSTKETILLQTDLCGNPIKTK